MNFKHFYKNDISIILLYRHSSSMSRSIYDLKPSDAIGAVLAMFILMPLIICLVILIDLPVAKTEINSASGINFK